MFKYCQIQLNIPGGHNGAGRSRVKNSVSCQRAHINLETMLLGQLPCPRHCPVPTRQHHRTSKTINLVTALTEFPQVGVVFPHLASHPTLSLEFSSVNPKRSETT